MYGLIKRRRLMFANLKVKLKSFIEWIESFADATDFHENDILYEHIERLEKEVFILNKSEGRKG
jgi:hypothetical protein